MTIVNILNDIIKTLQASNTSAIADGDLALLANATKDICKYAAALDAEIQKRAVIEGKALPGVVVKDAITHRKWHDAEIAAELAFKQLGIKAFKLESPAQIEKMGDEGKALVALASYKPEAGKRVVY